MQVFVVLFASLLSGVIGVCISIYYHKRAEKRERKFFLLKKLLGNRNDLRGEEFTEAINSVFVVFYGSDQVIKALKEFHECLLDAQRGRSVANLKLLELFKTMCEDLNIQTHDDLFLQPFNIIHYQE